MAKLNLDAPNVTEMEVTVEEVRGWSESFGDNLETRLDSIQGEVKQTGEPYHLVIKVIP